MTWYLNASVLSSDIGPKFLKHNCDFITMGDYFSYASYSMYRYAHF